MMTLVIKLLKSSFAAAAAILIVLLIIIFMGPRFGLKAPYNYLVAVVVLVGYLLFLMIQKMRAKKNAAAMEGFLSQQADDQLLTARPDVKDEIAAVKEKMERAIRILKKSKLGKGRRGSEALYILPWYMIIGPSACGKSTAIRNSGLSFPPIDPDSDEPGAIKGLGGTRNCDWWFTNEGIVLDTAGRYTISVDSAEDREEWSSFLGLLKKFRKRSPINGLLVMVSMDELVKQSEDGVEAHAKNIRQRIDELIVKLEIIFPVYLIFTKCDLLSGFVEFFGDLSKKEREQVWGYTCKYDPQRTTAAHEEFTRETDKLFDTLKSRRLAKLRSDLRPGDEKAVYLFPLEFDTSRKKLTAFVETLLQPNPFQQNPALRGVYFTSGTQEGTPVGQVMDAMAKEFGMGEDMAEILQPPKEPKAYFIKDLFTQVIMSDQARTQPTDSSAKRRKWMRWALTGIVGIGAILLALAVGYSYLGNRELLADTLRQAEKIEEVKLRDESDLIERIRELDGPRRHLEGLDDNQEGSPPVKLRWGLYKGSTVNPPTREKMLAKLTDLLIKPTAAKFEAYFRHAKSTDSIADTTRFTNVGNAYMMLTEAPDAVSSDVDLLVQQIEYVWLELEEQTAEWRGNFRRLAAPLLRYWWLHHQEVVRRDEQIYTWVKEFVRGTYSLDTYYDQLIGEANSKLRPFPMPRTTILTGEPIKAAYTKEGWEQQVEGLIKRSRQEIEQDPLKIDALGDQLENIENDLARMYFFNYRRAWQVFIGGIEVSPFHDISAAIDGLRKLSGAGTPIMDLLEKAADNSKIEWNGKLVEEIEDEFYSINEFFGRTGLVDDVTGGSSENLQAYGDYLKNADGKLSECEDALAGNVDCARALNNLGRQLKREREDAQTLISSASSLGGKASNLLGKPIVAARSSAYSNACLCLNEAWVEYHTIFEQQLAESYPFNAYGPDAPLDIIVNFFQGSTSGLGKFDREEAQPAARAGLSLNQEYKNALAAADQIRKSIVGGQLQVRFKMTAMASACGNARETNFRFAGTTLSYNMGTARSRKFTWSGNEPDCSVNLSPREGRQVSPMEETGPWALFKIFDKADFIADTVKWVYRDQGRATAWAGYVLSGGGAPVIKYRYFTKFRCPTRVCGQ